MSNSASMVDELDKEANQILNQDKDFITVAEASIEIQGRSDGFVAMAGRANNGEEPLLAYHDYQNK